MSKRKIRKNIGMLFVKDGILASELLSNLKIGLDAKIKDHNDLRIELNEEQVGGDLGVVITSYIITEESNEAFNARKLKEEESKLLVIRTQYNNAISILEKTKDESFFDVEFIKKRFLGM